MYVVCLCRCEGARARLSLGVYLCCCVSRCVSVYMSVSIHVYFSRFIVFCIMLLLMQGREEDKGDEDDQLHKIRLHTRVQREQACARSCLCGW